MSALRTYNGEFLKRPELEALGVTCGGDDVLVHASVVIVCPDRLQMGDHVRIDPFCVITAEGGIQLGNYIHISAHCSLVGGGGIIVEDFVTISHGARIFSVCDDVSGDNMVNPTVPGELRNVSKAPVIFKKHALVGSGAVIMPGVTVHEGGSVTPLTFVRRDIPEWSQWAAPSLREVRKRTKNVLAQEQDLKETPPPQK
jgi:acetyltransferase-like isoleucine patch superfamily enzyme